MHTPQQAASLWCPMVRAGSHSCNVDYRWKERSPEMARCIADKCAMWRLEGSTTYKFNPKFGLDLPSTKPTGRGYCGLAGRPEVMA